MLSTLVYSDNPMVSRPTASEGLTGNESAGVGLVYCTYKMELARLSIQANLSVGYNIRLFRTVTANRPGVEHACS